MQVKKLWIDGWSYSCNNQNVTESRNDNAENNVNEANNNAIHNGNNNANVNINDNQYGQLGVGMQNHILTVGVA